MITAVYEVLGVAWGYRWAALALALFSVRQAEPWPWTLAQMASCILVAGLAAAACGQVRREWLARRYGSPLLTPVPVMTADSPWSTR